jgi:predicted ferric reductase
MSNGNDLGLGTSADAADRSGTLARLFAGAAGSDSAGPVLPWFARGTWGAVLCAAYPVLALAPATAVRIMAPDADHSPVAELGITCALVGFTMVSLQFVLTARLRWVEAPFGLDVLLRFHRIMGLAAVGLLCAHPLLVAAGEGWGLLTRLHAPWFIWTGRIALALLVGQVIAALLRGAMRLPYEHWRRAHNAVAVGVLALGLLHAVGAGDDLHGRVLLIWSAAPALACAMLLYSRGIRPCVLARRAFRVHCVRAETPRVWTVVLDAPEGRPFHFLPGQFQFLRLLGSDVPSEEHPFTIASSPLRSDRIALTIKACGDFTACVGLIRPGDRATVHGPFGRFCPELHPEEGDLVMVAGGVGITPMMSILRAMRERREARRVTLVYASRTAEDLPFTTELTAMESGRCPLLRVVYVLSAPPAWWTGETGRVDVRRIEEWCGGLEGKGFYICCPPSMNVQLVAGLRRRGVSRQTIHCDHFSL